MEKQTGVASVTFRSLTPYEIIKLARQAGLDGVEWGGDVHVPCGAYQTAEETAHATREAGLSVLSYGSYFRLGLQRTEELKMYLKTAKALGAPIMRIWGGTRSGAMYSKDEVALLLSQAKQAAAIAGEYGIVLGLECHDSTITDDYAFARSFLESVDSPFFKTYWQPNRFRDFAYNLEALKALAPYIVTVHTQRWEGDVRLSLHGYMDEWRTYCGVLEQTGAAHRFILEFLPEESVECLKSEAEALREFLK